MPGVSKRIGLVATVCDGDEAELVNARAQWQHVSRCTWRKGTRG